MERKAGGSFGAITAGMAVTLSLVSLGVELTTHMCAQSFFDPLPEPIYVVAYAAMALMIAINAAVIRRADARIWERRVDQVQGIPVGPERRFGLEAALAGTGAAIAVALAYTLLFLPILPVSVIAILFMGVGLCAWSPVLNLLVTVTQFRALANRWSALGLGSKARPYLGGLCLGLGALMVLVGRPLLVGYHIEQALANPGHREQAVQRLRWLGAETEVLRLCYRDQSPWMEGAGRGFWRGPAANDVSGEARKLYYLLTGKPFETADASRIMQTRLWSRFDDPVVDQQGGELVGAAVRGLSLASSRLDGVLDPATETAYAEWTMLFRNTNPTPEEARAELVLPEGAVVDKVSLWIDGKERPAAFGPRSVVRQAYQDVAVVQRRDPLLVTAKDTGHVMAQCFPVPAGGEMKIRLGMTSPLVWEQPAQPRLAYALPTFQHVNFSLPAGVEHQVWLEGHWGDDRGQLAGEKGAGWVFKTDPAPPGKPATELTRMARLRIPVSQLLKRPALSIAGGTAPAPGDVLGGGLVRRTSPFPRASRPVDLLFLLSPTQDMQGAVTRAHRAALAEVLKELPAGSTVRFTDIREAVIPGRRPGTAWLEVPRLKEADGWWDGRRYQGGAEPERALEWAWDEALGRSNPTAVLWLHGPTPTEFKEAEHLLAAYRRRPGGPVLMGVLFGSGPDSLMRELAGSGRIFARTAGQEPDSLAQAVRVAVSALDPAVVQNGTPLGGREPALNGVYVASAPSAAAARASTRTFTRAERLAAATQVLAPWYHGTRAGPELMAAQKLAIRRRLVTPMSGAVVLETQAQYAKYNLSDSAAPASIPSVPEPGTVAMLAVAAAMAGTAALRRRRRSKPGVPA